MNHSDQEIEMLLQKLGYKTDEAVLTVGEPTWFGNGLEKFGITNARTLPVDWLHLFVSDYSELSDLLASYKLDLVKRGIWISWPKKTANLSVTISEQLIRDVVLPLGWVDTKVCTVDNTWSGLKFLRRKK